MKSWSAASSPFEHLVAAIIALRRVPLAVNIIYG